MRTTVERAGGAPPRQLVGLDRLAQGEGAGDGAREPGAGKLPALCDAPGDYVRVKAFASERAATADVRYVLAGAWFTSPA